MTARIITNEGAREVSDRNFFEMAFGHPPLTREQREAEHRAEVERYAAMILRGCELSEYGNPCVTEAKRLIALREGDAGVVSDPLLKRRVA